MSGAVDEVERAILESAQLAVGNDVLVLGGSALVIGAHERVGDSGWVYVVRSQVDELEELLGEAHAAGVSGVAYLVGSAPVLPLPDGAVAAALGRIATEDGGALVAAAEELARILADGGRVALAEEDRGEGEAVLGALRAAGFAETELREAGGQNVVTARLG